MKKKIWALVVGIACVLGSVFEVYVTLKLDPAISEQILRLLSI